MQLHYATCALLILFFAWMLLHAAMRTKSATLIEGLAPSPTATATATATTATTTAAATTAAAATAAAATATTTAAAAAPADAQRLPGHNPSEEGGGRQRRR